MLTVQRVAGGLAGIYAHDFPINSEQPCNTRKNEKKNDDNNRLMTLSPLSLFFFFYFFSPMFTTTSPPHLPSLHTVL